MTIPNGSARSAAAAAAPSGSEVLALRTAGLGFRVSGAVIVDDVTIEVPAGEFVGLIGPNGAGKTTLLNLFSGILRATSGTIEVNGFDVTRRSPHSRARLGVARTFQTSNLLLGLSVLENVRQMAQARVVRGLALLRSAQRADQTTDIAKAALDRVGLAGQAGVAVGSLSHGDRRKVELAIVLAAGADLVLLDEPMAGVNAEDVERLTELIRELHVESGATFLMVEHHLHVVLGLADRVAVLQDGALLAFDRPDVVMSDERVHTAYVGEEL